MSTKTNVNMSSSPSLHRPKKRKAGMWVFLILIIAALGGAGLWATTKLNTVVASTGGTYTVGRGPLTITVTEGGSIRAHESKQYKVKVERNRDVSEITILSIVPAGTYITQEDVANHKVLVQLDSSVLEDRLVQEKLSLTSAGERVTSSQESYQIQLIDNESNISNAELNVRFALLDLQKYLGGELANQLIEDVNRILPAADSNQVSNDSGSIKLAELIHPLVEQIRKDPNVLAGSSAWQQLKSRQDDIVIAEGNLKTQQDTLAGTRKLHDANYVSDLELQRDELTLKSREFSLQNSQINLNLFLDYDFPKSAEQSLSDYIEARRRLQRTYAQCRSREAQAKSSLSSARMTYEEQQNQVKSLEQQIRYCTITATDPGLVVYGEGSQSDTMRMMRGGSGRSTGGSGIIAEGESVFPGQTVISMPDTSSMVAEISVHETEVDKVRAGQKATIVMDAFPDMVLDGEVLEVAPLPDQSRGMMNPDTKVYQTLVAINGIHDFLKSRMSCKVNILVEKYDDVIQVPVQVISNRLGRKICYVINSGGQPEEREVQTGAFNDTYVQIKSGLEVGEVVLLNPLPFTDSASASFQEIPPTPEGEAPPVDNTQSPRRGMQGGRGGGMGGIPAIDLENMTEEQRQQYEQFMQNRGGDRGTGGGGMQGGGFGGGGTGARRSGGGGGTGARRSGGGGTSQGGFGGARGSGAGS